MRSLAPVLSFALLAACAVPAAAGDDEPPVRRAREGKPPRAAAEDPPGKADPVLDAWIRVLAERIADPNPAIRRSAAEGIAAAGRAALPVLGRLAGSEDRAVAGAAMRLIARIEVGALRGRGQRPGGTPGLERGPGRRPGAGAPPRAGRGRDRRHADGPPGLEGSGPRGPGLEGPGHRRGGAERDPLSRLDLTEDQRAKLEAFRREHREKAETAFRRVREEGPGPEEIRAVREKLREERREALAGILTPEQMERLEGFLEDRGPPRFGPGREGPPPGGGRPGGR